MFWSQVNFTSYLFCVLVAVWALDRSSELHDVWLAVWEHLWMHHDTWSKEEDVDQDEDEPEGSSGREDEEESEEDNNGLDDDTGLALLDFLDVLDKPIDESGGDVRESLSEWQKWVDAVAALAVFNLWEEGWNDSKNLLADKEPDVVESKAKSNHWKEADIENTDENEHKLNKSKDDSHVDWSAPEEHGLDGLVNLGVWADGIHVEFWWVPSKLAGLWFFFLWLFNWVAGHVMK